MRNSADYIIAAIERAGGPSAVAARLGIKPWAVSKWRIQGKVPPDRVVDLCEMGGWHVTPNQIAPDIYRHPDDGLPDAMRQCGNSGEAA